MSFVGATGLVTACSSDESSTSGDNGGAGQMAQSEQPAPPATPAAPATSGDPTENVITEGGGLVPEDPEPGDYWIIEIDAPDGFELARPRIVRYRGDAGEPANCLAAAGAQLRCQAASEGRPGFVMLVVPNRPAGLPPTDAIARRRR